MLDTEISSALRYLHCSFRGPHVVRAPRTLSHDLAFTNRSELLFLSLWALWAPLLACSTMVQRATVRDQPPIGSPSPPRPPADHTESVRGWFPPDPQGSFRPPLDQLSHSQRSAAGQRGLQQGSEQLHGDEAQPAWRRAVVPNHLRGAKTQQGENHETGEMFYI
ncbi:hypothetical protein F7725_029201 [Dissostichus mawsoni]|uniref:Uncharacterized protein n=1 Tax=Dissostichus mawsoni TaxID=36200 RepID=A0A7J5XIH1_DISMA|nr:hypothetical protein F7725_029201 [Dissostichus mawsoni]